MATLNIQAPDGKTLNVNIPEGTDPSKYDSIVDDVMADYIKNNPGSQEAPGALKSGALGLMSGIPGAETAVSGIESAFTPKTYSEAHQNLENEKNQAWDTHPVAYGAGKTAGMAGTALAAPASIPGAIGVGALSGVDAAANPSDIPKSAAEGAATGAALGTIGEKVVNPLLSKLPGLAKGALASLGAKTSVEDIQNYLQNPEAIRSALSNARLGEKVADVTSDIGKASGQLSGQARSLLNPTNFISGKDLKDTAMDAVSKYYTEGNPATAADQTSINAIVDQYQKLAAIADGNGGNVPEDTLRSMIDRMQAATKESTFGNPDASASQTALKEFSGKLNDLLRDTNPEYAEGMAPSAEMAKLSSDAKSQFSLKPNDSGELAPTDATSTKINNVTKEGKPQGAGILDRIKNATGQDLQDMINQSQTKENFDAQGAGPGLRALLPALGYGAGRISGVPFGGIIGAGAGHFAAGAINGGNVAKNILDMYMAGSKSEIGQLASKFGPVLANAAKTGGGQLAATHFVLATSNPEYQQLVDHVQNNSNNNNGY